MWWWMPLTGIRESESKWCGICWKKLPAGTLPSAPLKCVLAIRRRSGFMKALDLRGRGYGPGFTKGLWRMPWLCGKDRNRMEELPLFLRALLCIMIVGSCKEISRSIRSYFLHFPRGEYKGRIRICGNF